MVKLVESLTVKAALIIFFATVVVVVTGIIVFGGPDAEAPGSLGSSGSPSPESVSLLRKAVHAEGAVGAGLAGLSGDRGAEGGSAVDDVGSVAPVAAGAVLPNDAASRKVSRVSAVDSRVTFLPNHEFAGYTLTVAGPGGYRVTKTFDADTIPTFDVPAGMEGRFKYELVGTPYIHEDDYEEMMRLSDEGIAFEVEDYGSDLGDRAQSGTFAQIEDAVLLPDEAAEE